MSVIAAARAAGARDDRGAPVRLRHRIGGADGYALSGGQQQRVALARALFRAPFLLVLDEPNSNLDSVGEAALVTAIEATKERGRAVVLITHRPSLTLRAKTCCIWPKGRSAFRQARGGATPD